MMPSRKTPMLRATLFVLAMTIGGCADSKEPAMTPATATTERQVTVNDTRLTTEQVVALERAYRTHVQNGAYWYDRMTGAWGGMGGPTLGFIHPGLALGGTLRADASHGDTGVFINGRQLHRLDVLGLQKLGPVF